VLEYFKDIAFFALKGHIFSFNIRAYKISMGALFNMCDLYRSPSKLACG
jgi:hypothetical protein